MKKQNLSKTLQNGSITTQTEANTTPHTSQFYLYSFEHIAFKTYFVNYNVFKFKSTRTPNRLPGLPVNAFTVNKLGGLYKEVFCPLETNDARLEILDATL